MIKRRDIEYERGHTGKWRKRPCRFCGERFYAHGGIAVHEQHCKKRKDAEHA